MVTLRFLQPGATTPLLTLSVTGQEAPITVGDASWLDFSFQPFSPVLGRAISWPEDHEAWLRALASAYANTNLEVHLTETASPVESAPGISRSTPPRSALITEPVPVNTQPECLPWEEPLTSPTSAPAMAIAPPPRAYPGARSVSVEQAAIIAPPAPDTVSAEFASLIGPAPATPREHLQHQQRQLDVHHATIPVAGPAPGQAASFPVAPYLPLAPLAGNAAALPIAGPAPITLHPSAPMIAPPPSRSEFIAPAMIPTGPLAPATSSAFSEPQMVLVEAPTASSYGHWSFAARVYTWLMLGLVVTGLVAVGLHHQHHLIATFQAHKPLFWAMFLGQLLLVVALSSAVRHMALPIAAIVLMVYSAILGATTALLFAIYTVVPVASIFATAAAMFAGLALTLWLAKRELRPLGHAVIMTVIGLIAATALSATLSAGLVYWIAVVITIFLCVGANVFHLRTLQQLGDQASQEPDEKWAIIAAAELLLDLLNFFLVVELLRRPRQQTGKPASSFS